ncbi:hypothetical protein LP7551_01480 [Roseibium album]|nr:hypothetical protein LP7551_01480 [Roseibium album]
MHLISGVKQRKNVLLGFPEMAFPHSLGRERRTLTDQEGLERALKRLSRWNEPRSAEGRCSHLVKGPKSPLSGYSSYVQLTAEVSPERTI